MNKQEFITAIAALKAEDLEKAKASIYCNDVPCKTYSADEVSALVSNTVNYVHDRIDRLYNQLYDYIDSHERGHLPKITSREMLENALKALQMDKEYQVGPKKTVYASKDEKGITYIVG